MNGIQSGCLKDKIFILDKEEKNMSRYVSKKIKCNYCRHQYMAKILKSFFNPGYMDLDTNPHNAVIYDRILMCPLCGYATDRIEDEVLFEVYEQVNSESYQKVFKDTQMDETYKKLYLFAILEEIKQNYHNAGYGYLMTYWYLKEKHANTTEVLKKAIENYEKYLADTADVQSAIILIDCMRQSGKFEEAKETAESLLPYTEGTTMYKFVEYELELISQKDTESHSVKEVM